MIFRNTYILINFKVVLQVHHNNSHIWLFRDQNYNCGYFNNDSDLYSYWSCTRRRHIFRPCVVEYPPSFFREWMACLTVWENSMKNTRRLLIAPATSSSFWDTLRTWGMPSIMTSTKWKPSWLLRSWPFWVPCTHGSRIDSGRRSTRLLSDTGTWLFHEVLALVQMVWHHL